MEPPDDQQAEAPYTFGDRFTSDIVVRLRNEEGRDDWIYCHSKILTEKSRYFADRLSDKWPTCKILDSRYCVEVICQESDYDHHINLLRLLYVVGSADVINKVASAVMAVLDFRPSKDFDDFVGIEARITEIKSKFILQSEQVKVIGIFGPGGIGKTTTARVLYNQLSPAFPFNTFLEDIRGSYEKPCACFGTGFKVDSFKRCFANSSLEINHGLEVLAQKSLIYIQYGYIKMHRLLEQMGREIVKKQSMENPGKPHFLTDTDISDVLDENAATGNVLGIMLCTSEKIRICKSAIQGMSNLKFLYFNSSIFWIPQKLDFLPHILDCLPDKLILLHWNVCPLRFWPSKFSGKFLVELVMQYSQFEMLWEGTKPLQCLKMLDLSSSWNLKKIPDLSKATSLEELCLHDCRSLLELTSYIENATRLYRLDISGCTKIKDFPNVSESMVELNLSETGIKEVPPWIEKLFHLRKLIMCGCEKLKTISPNISKLENLELLCLRNYDLCDAGDHYQDREENLFEAIIKWGPDFKRSWRLRSDFFDVDYILPICLPEKALTSPITLRLCSKGIKTIPDCIRCLAGLTELDVGECSRLVALPPLPDSLLYLDAQGCESLKRIDSSFQNPKICLNFDNCSSLKQKARELIQTSACKYAVLPGEEVPAHFTHRASSGSLTINSTQRPLPSSFRFRACILLSNVHAHPGDNNDEWGESSLTTMSYSVRGKQNGRTVGSGSNQLLMPALYGNKEHLYIFEDFFTLNQDCPEAEGTTFTFLFRVHDKTWKVKGCGVRLLEVPHCILDGKETEDQE
ncbi:hypothetical protein DY000_02003664, partial [Brassica cretica]